MTQPVIFAALNDDLLFSTPPKPVLTALEQVTVGGAPFVWVTQRCGAEVMSFNTALGQPLPFIAEGGSVLYLPQQSLVWAPFDRDEAEAVGDYWAISLAGPYVQFRAGLRVLANELHHSLLGYGDITIERLQKMMGLSADAAQRAKARESSEPFLTPKAVTPAALSAAAEDLGFRVVCGERISYLLAEDVTLARAIARLLDCFQPGSAAEMPVTAGLGAWPRDQSLLAVVDRAIAETSADGAAEDDNPALPDGCRPIAATPAAWSQALLALAGIASA